MPRAGRVCPKERDLQDNSAVSSSGAGEGTPEWVTECAKTRCVDHSYDRLELHGTKLVGGVGSGGYI